MPNQRRVNWMRDITSCALSTLVEGRTLDVDTGSIIMIHTPLPCLQRYPVTPNRPPIPGLSIPLSVMPEVYLSDQSRYASTLRLRAFTLMELPPELLLYIISYVDRPADLLSLALVNRLLCSLIIPDHLEYRQIKCRSDSGVLWKHLLERPDLALNVRELRLALQHDKKLVPLKFRNKPLVSTSSIWGIIPKLVHLRAFSNIEISPVDTLLQLVESLSGHYNLEELCLSVLSAVSTIFMESIKSIDQGLTLPQDLTLLSSLQTLSHLTKFALFYSPREKNGDSATSVLRRCLVNTPNLTHLRFHAFRPLCLWDLLDSGELRWPMLEALTLSSFEHIHHSYPPYNTLPDLYGTILPNFLRRHPTIKRFSFDVPLVSIAFPVVDTALLPELYSLHIGLPHALTSLLFPKMSNTITHLRLTKPLSPRTTVAFPLLETFVYEPQGSPMSSMSLFFAAAPNLKKVYMQSSVKSHTFIVDLEYVMIALYAVEHLKKLSHLLGLFKHIKHHVLSEILLHRLPSLTCIDTTMNMQTHCMRVLRVVDEGGKSSVKFELIPRSVEDPRQYDMWGGFYEGEG